MKNKEQILKYLLDNKIYPEDKIKEFRKNNEIPIYTKSYWKTQFNREIKKGEKPIIITLWIKDKNKYKRKKCKLYKEEQTY